MSKYRWIIAVLLLGVIAFLVRANARGLVRTSSRSGETPEVMVMPVHRATFVPRVVAPAGIMPAEMEELRAPFAADSIQVLVKAGDRIAAGQVLFELDTEQLTTDIRKQEDTVNTARTNLAQARLQAEITPWNNQMRRLEAQRRVERAEQALADARASTGTDAQELERKVSAARQSLAALRIATVVPGPVEVEAARQALSDALAKLAADPLDSTQQALATRLQGDYQDVQRKSLQQAASHLKQVEAAEVELKKLEDAWAGSAEASQEKVTAAEVELEKARFDLKKLELEIQGAATQDQLRTAEQSLQNAEKTLADLLEKAGKSTVKAPFAGVVLQVAVVGGQSVNAGVALGQVGVVDRMELNIQVDEADIGNLAVDLPLVLRTPAFPGRPFPGRITDVSVQAAGNEDPRMGKMPGMGASFLVRGEVENPDQMLRIGQNGDVEITGASRAGVIMLGLEAIRRDQGQRYVYVLTGDAVHRRPVEAGQRSSSQVEIVSGLDDGDVVVMGPFAVLKDLEDGQAVKVMGGGVASPPPGGPMPTPPAGGKMPAPGPAMRPEPAAGGGRAERAVTPVEVQEMQKKAQELKARELKAPGAAGMGR